MRVNEDAERRGFQPFGAHRPLLERLPRRIGGEKCDGAGRFRHRADDCLRPVVERIGYRMATVPALERRPQRSADIAEQHNGFRPLAVRKQRPHALLAEIHLSAQKNTVRRQRRTDIDQGIEAAGHCGPLYS